MTLGVDVKVSVFSDIVCPWCYIGVTRFERAAAAVTLSSGTEFETTLRAYQLDPQAESNGTPLVESLASKFGGEDDAKANLERVRAAGTPDGLDFDFESAVEANTFDAHRLLTWAVAHDGVARQRDLAHELWRAHFVEGADVADHDTLIARAGLVGLDVEQVEELLSTQLAADEVQMQRDTARDLGITSVPTFVIEGRWMITGAQPQDALERALKQLSSADETEG